MTTKTRSPRRAAAAQRRADRRPALRILITAAKVIGVLAGTFAALVFAMLVALVGSGFHA